jgi:mono/diheme cytochrome c family protein
VHIMATQKMRRGLLGGLAALLLVAAAVVSGALSRPSPRPAPAAWWASRTAIGRGARDFATGSCISCHALAGVSNANAAIDLTHEGRRRSAAWLLHEIIHPTSDRPATPPGQEHDLAAYLASLH